MSDPFNLEHLRKEAKSILKRCRSGDEAALERVRSQLPLVNETQIRLADVHQAMAREKGYRRWAELKQKDTPLSRFLTAVRRGDLKDALRALEDAPELPEESVHVTGAIGDVDGVAYHIEKAPESLRAEADGWTPLLYACASPFHQLGPRHSAGIAEAVKFLLDRGVDPNSKVLWDPLDPESRISAVQLANLRSQSAVSLLLTKRGAVLPDPKTRKKQAWRLQPRHPIDQMLDEIVQKDPEFQNQLAELFAPFRKLRKPWLSDPTLRRAAIAIAELLLKKGVSPNIATARGGAIRYFTKSYR